MPEDVTAYGATPDDSSDDTDAFNAAAEAAAGGTVYIPEGTFTINSKSARGAAAVHLSDSDVGGTSFVGAGPDKTTVKMEGDHEYTHMAITYAGGEDHDGAIVRDLTLDGNQWNQGPRPDGETPPNGFAIIVEGSTQNVSVENCRVKDWATTGGLYQAKGVTVRYCSFLDCGAMVWDRGGWRGHGFNVGNDASSIDEEGLLCEYCYFTGSSGTSIDNNGGNFTMRRCYSEDQQYAVKFNDGTRTTIENCRWRDLSHRGIYTTTDDRFPGGMLELYDVALEDIGWEAIASKLSGSVEGDNVHIDNANHGNNHKGEGIRFKDKSVSLSTLCVTNTQHGGVFDATETSGSVNELIHGDNSDGLGETDDISIENETNGKSFTVDAPTAADVGVNPSSDDSSTETTSYDHTLLVEAESDLTYGITVSGEAKLGDQADSMESVTRTDEGNHLLEGKTLAGGSDSFEFNGEVLPDRSNIDGDGTAYVDGSEVSLTVTETTSYDHTLLVEAESDLIYGITVSGEAKLGDQADSMESVTRTDEGNHLLEGKTLAGGSDSFEFNGEVLPDRSNIDGDGTAYVDGSQVDLSPEDSSDGSDSDSGFGSYTLPEPGSADWHQPLNNNFNQLGQDVQTLNARLNELEDQIN